LLGDSKGDHPAATKLLDHILASDAARSATEHLRALVLRADLAVRMGQRPLAERLLGDARRIRLTDQDRKHLGDELRRTDDLAEAVAGMPQTPPRP
jgi:hypothetical protein